MTKTNRNPRDFGHWSFGLDSGFWFGHSDFPSQRSLGGTDAKGPDRRELLSRILWLTNELENPARAQANLFRAVGAIFHDARIQHVHRAVGAELDVDGAFQAGRISTAAGGEALVG